MTWRESQSFKDIISIQTWPSKFSGPTGIREFLVKDSKGNTLIKAVSQWVMIDLNRLRPTIVQNMFDCTHIEFGEDQEIALEKLPSQTENKTIRFPIQLIEDIEKVIKNKDVTFSRFVIQACEYALNNIEDKKKDSK